MNPLMVVCLHDGFYGCGTGAGQSNRAFLDALTRALPSGVDLLVLPVAIEQTSPEYDASWHAQTQRILNRVTSRVIPLNNGTQGRTRWGTLDNFRTLAAHTADVLVAETRGRRKRMIVAHDVPFFGLPPLLPPELITDLVLVPHSTAAIHEPRDRQRINWENFGLVFGATSGARVGAIADYMRRHLIDHYGIPKTALIDLPLGLSPTDWTRTPPRNETLPEIARDEFWFAMGRAVPYKGFDDLLDALALLRDTGRAHPPLVLAAVSNKTELTAYQQQLATRIRDDPLNAMLLPRFSPGIADLLAHPSLRAVIVPSRVEPFGRIPIEAFAANAAPVIATTAGGLAEQVINGITGFSAPPGDPPALATALVRAIDQPDQQRQRMRQAARSLASARYDYHRAVQRFLTAHAPWSPQHQPTPQP